jgi:toxin YhaV
MNIVVINGWTVLAHPLFLEQVEWLKTKVEILRAKDPRGYKKNATKRLAAILKLAFEVIPQDPSRPEYRQGSTLEDEYKHWFRAKFFQRYRLLFRYHRASRVIVYAWVNDEGTKRAYDNFDDAYRVFSALLQGGNSPDNWDALRKEANSASVRSEKVKDSKR